MQLNNLSSYMNNFLWVEGMREVSQVVKSTSEQKNSSEGDSGRNYGGGSACTQTRGIDRGSSRSFSWLHGGELWLRRKNARS